MELGRSTSHGEYCVEAEHIGMPPVTGCSLVLQKTDRSPCKLVRLTSLPLISAQSRADRFH
jgi:hypothetical protein